MIANFELCVYVISYGVIAYFISTVLFELGRHWCKVISSELALERELVQRGMRRVASLQPIRVRTRDDE